MLTDWIDCENQKDLDQLIAEHGENLRVRIVGEWERVDVPQTAKVGNVWVDGTVTGDVWVDGTVTGNVWVDGTVTGDVCVHGTVTGGVGVDGTVTGDVCVHGTVTGGVWVDGTVTGDVWVDGTVTGNVWVYGTVTGNVWVHGTKLRGSHLAQDFAAGPMLELFAACPGGLEAAARGWGNKNWRNCPLHEALASVTDVGSFDDVDKIITDPKLRIYARLFVSLHDQGRLQMPEVAA